MDLYFISPTKKSRLNPCNFHWRISKNKFHVANQNDFKFVNMKLKANFHCRNNVKKKKSACMYGNEIGYRKTQTKVFIEKNCGQESISVLHWSFTVDFFYGEKCPLPSICIIIFFSIYSDVDFVVGIHKFCI